MELKPLIRETILINATEKQVWEALTNPDLMQRWMGDDEMKVEIITDWQEQNSIIFRGFHHIPFENKGVVLKFEPEKILRFTHLSTLSQLPEVEENFTILEFRLTSQENHTILSLLIENFPTETIFKHLEFYWITTLRLLKQFVENQIAEKY